MSIVNGKVALITGGASGIGIRYAKELLRNGLKGVTLADINPEFGSNALKEIENEFGKDRAIFVETDVTDKKQMEDAFKRSVDKFKQLDIVINSAGILNDAIWEKEISINCHGTVYGTLLAVEDYLQKYRSGEEGIVINMSSVVGLDPWEVVPVYSGTKHFVIGFSKGIGSQVHYERTKVRVLVVCPGSTDTPLREVSGRNFGPAYDCLIEEALRDVQPQKPEHVASELITVLKKGETGSVWVIEAGEPAYEIEFKNRSQRRK